MHCEGVLTGHAGYFNMGGLHRLDIPGQGVSCVRTSLLRDTVVQQCDCAEFCSHVAHTRFSCRNTLLRRQVLHREVLFVVVRLVCLSVQPVIVAGGLCVGLAR